MPPMQYIHSVRGLSNLLQENLAEKTSYKRKRLIRTEIASQNNETQDNTMELESDDEIIKDNSFVEPQLNDVDTVNDERSNGSTDESACKSNDASNLLSNSSLNELKRKKEELLKALADNTFDQDSSSAIDIDLSFIKDNRNSEDGGNVEENMNQSGDVDNPSSLPNVSESPPSTPTVSGRLKETVNGTPLINQVSPFSNLPSSENWSIGVSDVIDFENLPDAVGTYRKMSEIIRKVRVFVRNASENSEPES